LTRYCHNDDEICVNKFKNNTIVILLSALLY